MVKVRQALGRLVMTVALVVFPAFTLPAWAETGTVNIEILKAGFIVGVGGGRGTLIFHGRHYPLRIGGLSFGATIGASKA